MQLGFSIDVSRCSGCMACVVACLDQNDETGTEPSFRHITKLEKGVFPQARIFFLSQSCLHCGNAPCLQVCPTKAIYKRSWDGVVDINPDLCMGCHSCALACPFGAPRYGQDGKMSKCHLCIKRVDAGLDPACVRVCPTRALRFGPVDDLSIQKAEKASKNIIEAFVTNLG